MILADAYDAAAAGIDHPVGISAPAGGVMGRGQARIEAVEPLIGEVGEDESASKDRVCPSAILMHPGSGIEGSWNQLIDPSSRIASHDDRSSPSAGRDSIQ